jgi:hypothetical protein
MRTCGGVPSVGIAVRSLGLCSAATLLVCAACASSPPQPPEAEGAAPDMMAIPQPLLDKCTDVADLEASCPTKMPQVINEGHRARAFRSGRSSVFFVEWGGPYPGLTPRNAPPRFAHLNVIASPIDHPLAFKWPTRATTPLGDLDNVPKRRDAPLLLGAYTWGDRQGEVALGPSFPAGGSEGDHLIYRWIEADTAYSISLHAWKPAVDSFDALRAVVASLSVN